MTHPDYTDPDSLPTHYDSDGNVCSRSGGPRGRNGRCPDGCDHANHYANDGHEECADDSMAVSR